MVIDINFFNLLSKDNYNFHDGLLYKEFLRIKNTKIRSLSVHEMPLIMEIIDKLPIPEILMEFIFTRYKYNILIKHEALIKCIDLNQIEIVEQAALKCYNHELVKTAIHAISNDFILQFIALGLNNNIPETHKKFTKKLGLRKIKNSIIFTNTVIQSFTKDDYLDELRKIKFKSSFRNLSDYQKRIIPLLISQLREKSVIKEFSNSDKYPDTIVNMIKTTHPTIYGS